MMPINGRAFCLRYAAEKVEGVELRADLDERANGLANATAVTGGTSFPLNLQLTSLDLGRRELSGEPSASQ
jgi:hypothetical protein